MTTYTMQSRPGQGILKCASSKRSYCKCKPQETSLEQVEDLFDSTEGTRLPEASDGSASNNQSCELGRSEACNLDRFLEFTTPVVRAQFLAKEDCNFCPAKHAHVMQSCQWDSCQRRRSVVDVETKPYFALGDLWDSFDEWSAFGAGVPIILNGEENVVQYYVPYLSAIQLYVSSIKKPPINLRCLSDDSDISSDSDFKDTSSETSSDSEILCHCERFNGKGPSSSSETGDSKDKSVFWNISGEYQFNDAVCEQEKIGHLLFEFFERAPPHARVPLADKVAELSKGFKELRTLRTIDLLPTSWVSVAWYPIYRIPMGPTLKDLAACFLSYHTLSTPLQDNGISVICANVKQGLSACNNSSEVIALPAFGLASYKLRGATWMSGGNSDKRRASSLMKYTDAWLKQLRVRQPDYEFFRCNSGRLR